MKPSEKVKEMNKVVDSTTPVRQLVKHFDKLNIASDNYHLDNANGSDFLNIFLDYCAFRD